MKFQEMNSCFCAETQLLGLADYRIKECFIKLAHQLLQNIAYNIIDLKSTSTSKNTTHKFYEFSRKKNSSRQTRILAENKRGFLTVNRTYSSYLFTDGTFQLKNAERCCCGGKFCFQRFNNEPSFPATHGLKAHGFFIVKRDATSLDPWLLTHAALVFLKKQWPTEYTEYTEKK